MSKPKHLSVAQRLLRKPPDAGIDAPPSFRFVDLPKQIRLMIYECLPDHNTKRTLLLANGVNCVTLIRPSIPGIHILATCRLINAEALPVLAPVLAKMLRRTPQVVVHLADLVGHAPIRIRLLEPFTFMS